MHWMSVKLPDNFQMREHSWPCRFHIMHYSLMEKNRLPFDFVDNDLLYRGAHLKQI